MVPDDLREVRAYVTLPKSSVASVGGEKIEFDFVVTDVADGNKTKRGTNFRKPAQ